MTARTHPRATRRRPVSLPAPPEFPRDLDLHRHATQRPLEPRDLAAQLVGLGALGLALQPLGAGREELLAPLSVRQVTYAQVRLMQVAARWLFAFLIA
jgi:hypothetical protein